MINTLRLTVLFMQPWGQQTLSIFLVLRKKHTSSCHSVQNNLHMANFQLCGVSFYYSLKKSPCQLEEYHPSKKTRAMKNLYSILCVCTCVHTCRLPCVKVRRHHSGVSSSSHLARQCPACCFCGVSAVLMCSG